jgi:hypothetical protein
LKRESVDYFRARERDERKAARNAACHEARRAHDQMANAYARLVEIHDLEQVGALPPGKVTSIMEALHDREESE